MPLNYLSTVTYGKTEVSLLDCFIYTTIDPGGGTSAVNANSKTDKVGWTVGATTLQNDNIILEVGEEHMEVPEMVNVLYRIHKQWRPRTIGIERMMYLQQYLMTEMQRRHKVLHLYTLQHKGRSKAERIKAIIPFLSRTYFTDATIPLVTAAFNRWHEKMMHGDDWIDSLAYYFDIALPPDVNSLQQYKRERMQAQIQDRIAQLSGRSRLEAEAMRTRERGDTYQDELQEMFYDEAA